MDYNVPYIVADNIDDLIKSLEEASVALFQRFDNSLLKQPWQESFTNKWQKWWAGEITWCQIRLEAKFWWSHFWYT